MKLLCTADLHIGRRPSGLPSQVACHPLSCAEAWGRVAELAIAERVDVVAVSGDLVDRANRFYEATGPVELGIRRLAQAGIVTVMVAGNHDHDVLPRVLAGLESDQVRLLGQHGEWERFTLQRNGETLHIDGWSFPEAVVTGHPVASYPFAADGAPVLGMLHADIDQPGSRYAPVSLAELRPRAPDLWLLGHVHAPRIWEDAGSATVLYPGSPQAMDPGEAGAHGVWIAEIGPDRTVRCRMIPLATVRYETVEVDVEGVVDEAEVDRRIVDGVNGALGACVLEAPGLRHLSCRIRLVGRTALHRRLESRPNRDAEDLVLSRGEATAFIERVTVATAPERALEALAVGRDAPAVLARLIAAVPDSLLRDVELRVDAVRRATPYLALVRNEEDDRVAEAEVELSATLRDQAILLLDELLAQKETAV